MLTYHQSASELINQIKGLPKHSIGDEVPSIKTLEDVKTAAIQKAEKLIQSQQSASSHQTMQDQDGLRSLQELVQRTQYLRSAYWIHFILPMVWLLLRSNNNTKHIINIVTRSQVLCILPITNETVMLLHDSTYISYMVRLHRNTTIQHHQSAQKTTISIYTHKWIYLSSLWVDVVQLYNQCNCLCKRASDLYRLLGICPAELK